MDNGHLYSQEDAYYNNILWQHKKQGVSPENVEKIKLRLNFAVINVL